ncbi:winged helix-turn-helix domain-containing protein [Vibrio superstes]|uniref:DNA-binding transcriptional activator CadC n=1 Tax=Vibrio superstes NBRC 103154 TaxID=1219062 RepID=A0A511QT87_9VIBR|nr:winged helix-turn-helix domain-containing protein [Vibrio superstes]GEM80257.1 DNA-binding transcriptional activator CadC [Vibrio superstes NBRC 103154]
MKTQKEQFKIDEWMFVPYEDKFILHGETIVIDNRLSKLFHFLCENPDTVFSRDELINEVWNGSILSDQVITQAIFELRKILKQHGNHPYGYIVTVPKRGYKLDATVERVIESPKALIDNVFRDEEPEAQEDIVSADNIDEVAEDSTSEAESSELETTPTVDVQKANGQKNDTQKGKVTEKDSSAALITASTKPSLRKSNNKPWWALLAVLVVAIVIGLYVKNTQKAPEVVQSKSVSIADEPEATKNYLSLEPRYVHVIVDPKMLDDDYKIGIAKTILDFLKVYQDVRITYSGPASKVAAHEITLDTSTSQNKNYLEIEYVNRISGHKHLDRKYDISGPAIKSSIKRALDDMLDSFHIEIDKDILAKLVDELPDNEYAIQSILTAYATIYHPYTHGRGIELIQEAESYAPDDPYTIATSYTYSISYLYLHPTSNNDKAIADLNARTTEKFALFTDEEKKIPKVMEAMAMMALSNDDSLKATNILQAIPYNRKTVIYYILNGKAAELRGNRDSAEEFYYNAVLEASSTLTLNLAEVLFFNSDLSDIKQKIEENSF